MITKKSSLFFSLMLLQAATIAFAQTTVLRFHTDRAGKLQFQNSIGPAGQNQMLPLKLVFDSSFKNRTVRFYQTDNTSTAYLISQGRFGDDYGTANGTLNYEINIKTNNSIDPDPTGNNATVSGGRFYFSIDSGASLYGPFILVSYHTSYTTGSAIRDALTLKSLDGATPSDSLNRLKLHILRSYGITNSTTLGKNFYLVHKYNGLFDKKLGYVESTASGGTGFLPGLFASIGGLDVTTIADGFARFIVKRVKQELSSAFFDDLKKKLALYPDLATVFPKTSALLQAVDQEVYNYNNYISHLREAFRSDLQSVDEHLPGIVDNHAVFFSKPGHFELGLGLRTGCYISSSLKHDVHPADILANYPIRFFDSVPVADQPALTKIKWSIQSLQLLSESVKETDTSRHAYWVGPELMRQLVNDKDALQIYFGLLMQMALLKYDKVQFSDNESLYSILNTDAAAKAFATDYPAYRQYVSGMGELINELNTLVQKNGQSLTDSAQVEQFIKYGKAAANLLQYSVQISALPYVKTITGDLVGNASPYFDLVFEVMDLAAAVNRKKYAEVVNELAAVYNTAVVQPHREAVDEQIRAKLPIDSSQRIFLSDNTLAAVVKYGAFMTSMIGAETSEDVETAIENTVLPAGSSKIKRTTPLNISLNAYAGLYYGHESISGLKDRLVFNSFGLTAPIGIAVSTSDKKGWSHSLFLSVVDLGAVAAFRFGNDSAAQVPTLQLKDIFSPGLFYSLGIPRSPISINTGVQIGPNLRTVSSATNDYANKTYVRLSVSVCVDLPLLNLYTKPPK